MILVFVLILGEDFVVERIRRWLIVLLRFLLLSIRYASAKIGIPLALVHSHILHLKLLDLRNFALGYFTWGKSPLWQNCRTFDLLPRLRLSLLKLLLRFLLHLNWLLLFEGLGFMLWLPGRLLFGFPQIFGFFLEFVNWYARWLWYRLSGHLLVRFRLIQTRIFFGRLQNVLSTK